jgi:hypothetical protein
LCVERILQARKLDCQLNTAKVSKEALEKTVQTLEQRVGEMSASKDTVEVSTSFSPPSRFSTSCYRASGVLYRSWRKKRKILKKN